MSDPWAEFTPAPPRATSLSNDPWAEFTPVSSGGVRTEPGQGGRPTRVIMDMGGGQRPTQQPSQPSDGRPGVIEDAVRGFGGGLIRGAAGTVGLVTDTIPNVIVDSANWLESKLRGEIPEETQARIAERRANSPLRRLSPALADMADTIGEHLTTEGIQRDIESITGPAYVPQTRTGRFASTAAEFVPGGMIGKLPNLARNAVAFGLIPGLISEGAGQTFEGGAMETPARIVGGLAGGFGSAAAMRRGVPAKMVQRELDGVTPQQIDQAERLFLEAQQAGQPISRAEALQAVTQGRTGLGDLQHTVEGMGGMREFYAGRPAQNEAAARSAFDTVSPQAVDPSQLGQFAGDAAGDIVRQSPEANILSDVLWRAGPRVTPEQAGNVIQSELGQVYQGREGMRAALAERDYGAARNAPATIPLNGGHRIADVTKHYLDRPDIPIILDQAERNAAKTQWFKDNNPTTRMPIVGERATEFGQVDASAVVRQLDAALSTAKGAVKQGLQAARATMFRPDGSIDMSVAGLHNARQAIGDLISQAKLAGANHTASRLLDAQKTLDHALEQIPAYGQARVNFQNASRPLDQFERNRVPGRIVERDQYNNNFVMPPDRATAAIEAGGPSAARDFNAVATPAAREAFEQNIVTQVLDRASREGVGLSSDSIRQALRQNEDLLRQYPGVRDKLESIAIARDGLAKVERSQLGQIARRDLTTKQAIEALFPSNPLPNSVGEIDRTMRALSARNPMVARQLVRTHAEGVFNEATQRLASGPSQSGGAKFAAILRGNPQQAANLEAAVRALPNGEQIWPGFNRFLEILEAQQFRQATGSRTAFKIAGVEDLKSGGITNNLGQVVASGGFKWPQKAMQAIQNWNVGRNLDELARLLTDPAAAKQFRTIATAPRGSNQALAITAHLIVNAANRRNFEDRPGEVRGGPAR